VIRYQYNQQVTPPAPFVHVTLGCRETRQERANVPAQLDTAADRTVLPGELVDELRLVPLDEIAVSGFGGQVMLLPTYRVDVSVHDLPPVTVEVLAHPDESFVLLGRDVLNGRRLVLDGPRLTLEIE
jgi:hypothetical protein